MIDNEIIKALEYCDRSGCCCGCPYGRCIEADITELALDLINRQKAEIERLKKLNDKGLQYDIELMKREKTAKAEAVKEFAERLKDLPECQDDLTVLAVIDDLVKEMAGDNNGT